MRVLLRDLPPASTFVTASTGIAAVNIGGITIHSFAGIGTGDISKIELAKNVLETPQKNWWLVYLFIR